MKLSKLFFTCILLFLPFSNVFSEKSSSNTANINNTENTCTVKISGMSCTSCEKDIEQTFQAKKEVESVDAVFDGQSIKLVFKDGMKLSDEEIKSIIADLGYKVKSIS